MSLFPGNQFRPGVCPIPWKGLDGICNKRGDMCQRDVNCKNNLKCCFNGCQKDCVSGDPLHKYGKYIYVSLKTDNQATETILAEG